MTRCIEQKFRAGRMPPGATTLETFAGFRDWKAAQPDKAEAYLRQFDEAEALPPLHLCDLVQTTTRSALAADHAAQGSLRVA